MGKVGSSGLVPVECQRLARAHKSSMGQVNVGKAGENRWRWGGVGRQGSEGVFNQQHWCTPNPKALPGSAPFALINMDLYQQYHWHKFTLTQSSFWADPRERKQMCPHPKEMSSNQKFPVGYSIAHACATASLHRDLGWIGLLCIHVKFFTHS